MRFWHDFDTTTVSCHSDAEEQRNTTQKLEFICKTKTISFCGILGKGKLFFMLGSLVRMSVCGFDHDLVTRFDICLIWSDRALCARVSHNAKHFHPNWQPYSCCRCNDLLSECHGLSFFSLFFVFFSLNLFVWRWRCVVFGGWIFRCRDWVSHAKRRAQTGTNHIPAGFQRNLTYVTARETSLCLFVCFSWC